MTYLPYAMRRPNEILVSPRSGTASVGHVMVGFDVVTDDREGDA